LIFRVKCGAVSSMAKRATPPSKMKKKTPLAKKKSSRRAAATETAATWPGERQVMFRPARLKYVRKIDRPAGCVFCAAVEMGPNPDSLLLYRGAHAIVILNKFPYNNGHILVLPRRHCGDFLELTKEEHAEIAVCMTTSIAAIKDAYNCAGFNCGLNLGAASGAGIPEHLHYHIVPRWVGDTNFFPLLADTKVVVETLDQTYERLAPYFQELQAEQK
jgi:ATP adenylyltransferase